ncbi:MAG: hypothetical protein AAGA56_31580, partial [Myxococcota bacterium]
MIDGNAALAPAKSLCRIGLDAAGLPIARRTPDGSIQVVVMLYGEPARAGREDVYPPHTLVVIDPTTGEPERPQP